MTCDGSGELRWGWTCPGCDACHPPRLPAPSGRLLTDERRREVAARARATDPWRQ